MEITSIHKKFHQILYNYIALRVSNHEDVADILQEVFIKIATNIKSLGNTEKLQAWIFAITRNAIIDNYRKNSKSKIADITESIINETREEVDVNTTKGLDKCIRRFIKELPEEYRDIIIDSEIKGIRQKDLSEKYGLAYPSVRSRVQRGRGRLKVMLLKCCSIEADSRGNILEASNKSNREECSNCD